MSKLAVIIITGLPCTGKTALARRIGSQLSLPVVGRDDIKELLFGSLGWKDREWSRTLGRASWDLLYYAVDLLLTAGKPFVVESNFTPELANARILALKGKHDFEPLQIVCCTDGPTLFERFRQRSESGERHPGHVDHLNYDELGSRLLKNESQILDIGGKVVEVDTTDFSKLDYPGLFALVQEAISSSDSGK